jgi:hypothetical protein
LKDLVKKEKSGGEEFFQKLIDSKSLPTHIKTVEQAFTIAQMGKELGFAEMQSFHYIIPIQGKLSLSATALNALLRVGGVKFITIEDGVFVYPDGTVSEYKKEGDVKPVDIRTTIIFHRDGLEERCTFTWNEATAMGITGKDNWKRMPKAMLYARCLAKGARRIGADLLLGLYTVEELFDHSNDVKAKRNEDGEIIEILD